MRKARPRPPRISLRATFAFAMSFRIVNNPISAPRWSKCISDAMLQRPANAGNAAAQGCLSVWHRRVRGGHQLSVAVTPYQAGRNLLREVDPGSLTIPNEVINSDVVPALPARRRPGELNTGISGAPH